MKILVAGATGKVGHHLVEQLAHMGHQVRALTRQPDKAKFSAGVEVVAGDLTKPETVAGALEGVTGLHLINFGGDDFAPLSTGAEIIAMAVKSGVQRVTVLRGGDKTTVEEAVENSSLDWTFLQPVEFMSNVLDWADSIRTERVIRQGFANRKSAIVHEADIAAVAAVALTQAGHGGQSYWITGGEVLTPIQMVQTISTVIGQNIQLIELTEAEAREQWRAKGFSDEFIEFFAWAYGNTPVEGYTVSPIVEQVTGRPPRTLAQWVSEHVEFFR